MPTGDKPYVPYRRKRRTYRKKSGVRAVVGQMKSSSGASRESLIKAAQVLCDQAKVNAAKFSKKIPAATYVEGLESLECEVVTDGTMAPNAAPFEFGERHPLFGDRSHWYKQPTRAYMDKAAKNAGALTRASDIFGTEETKLLGKQFGYTE